MFRICKTIMVVVSQAQLLDLATGRSKPRQAFCQTSISIFGRAKGSVAYISNSSHSLPHEVVGTESHSLFY